MKAYTDIINEFEERCGYIEKVSSSTWDVYLYHQYKGEMNERQVQIFLDKFQLYLL